MAIQFPANPNVGDPFTSEGALRLGWDCLGGFWQCCVPDEGPDDAQLVGTDASGDLVDNDAPVDGAKYTRQNGGCPRSLKPVATSSLLTTQVHLLGVSLVVVAVES